jgi:arylsulfatase A-like enzyme
MKRPNLLVVHTDQQSCWTIGAYGGSIVETPHMDRIAREGAHFTNFFTNSAFCTPSRGCFLTGRYPHNHGAYDNNIPLNRDEVTFAQVLKNLGYATGYSGKWHLDGRERPGWVHQERSMGFTDCRYMFNRGHWKKIEQLPMGDMQPTVYPYKVIGDEQTYTTDWLTGKTEAFIRDHRDKSFCYMVSFPDPHQIGRAHV